MNIDKLTIRAREAIGYYVYCLVDPRDSKVFYVGKGKGDRVFSHVLRSENVLDDSEKIHRINEIGAENVKHYIIRYGLSEKEALEIEATLIDFLMDERVTGSKHNVANLISGHHHYDKGIKSIDEMNARYPEPPIVPENKDNLIVVILKSYNPKENIDKQAFGDWVLTENQVSDCTHVLATYHGVVRAVYKVERKNWKIVKKKQGRKPERWRFKAKKDSNSIYLNTTVYRTDTKSSNSTIGTSKSCRKKVDYLGNPVNPRRAAWCLNYNAK
jgi:hypothetical protein